MIQGLKKKSMRSVGPPGNQVELEFSSDSSLEMELIPELTKKKSEPPHRKSNTTNYGRSDVPKIDIMALSDKKIN